MAQGSVLQITLSDETWEFVHGKVTSGANASEQEAVLELIEEARLDAMEQALFEQEEVIPAYEESLANPSSAIPIDQVRRNLEAAIRERSKAS
jgi:hypothetical protein